MRALLVFALSTASQGQQVACVYDDSLCTYNCAGSTLDLTALKTSSPNGYLTAVDDSQQTYYFGICGALTTLTCGTPKGEAAIQTWSNPPPPDFPTYECANAGTWASQACTMLDGVMTCLHTGGDSGRSIQIMYTCGDGTTETVAIQTQPSPPAYLVTVSSPSSCMVAPSDDSSKGLSTGGLFLILFSVAVIMYIGGGLYYNIKHKSMPQTMESFPHIEYWRELPGLVKDGCQFSWKHTKRAAREAHSWYVGGDASLKEGLTAADEGEATMSHAKESVAPLPSKSGPDF